jgi:hypothetical protein
MNFSLHLVTQSGKFNNQLLSLSAKPAFHLLGEHDYSYRVDEAFGKLILYVFPMLVRYQTHFSITIQFDLFFCSSQE